MTKNATNGYLVEARVVDGTGAPPIEDGAVVTAGDRIAWVGKRDEVPEKYRHPEVEVISLLDRSVVPGLVDAHIHISFGEATSEEENALYTPVEYRSILAGWNARRVLQAGVTSAFDAASTYNISVAVRDAIEAGLIEGPRLASAGQQLTSHQGLEDAFPSWMEFPVGQAGVLVKSRDDILEAVRLQVKNRVDVIKVSGSNDSAVTEDSLEGMAFRQEEFDLIADETHRLGRKCTVHARTADSVKACARAGFDWLQHASYIDDEGLELVLENNIPISPVMTLLVNIISSAEEAGRAGASSVDVFKQELDAAATNLTRAYQSGVTMVAGSESGWSLVPYGQWHAKEMEIFVEFLGMSPVEALHAGTGAAALTLPRWSTEIGTLEVGKRADLILLPGNVATDITLLQHKSRFDMVMKDGKPIDITTPIPERSVYSWERTKILLPGLFNFDEEAGKGHIVPK
jgi:imidazolonepropionase-like amidohydrolase